MFRYDLGAGEVPVICGHGNPDSADARGPLVARAGDPGRVAAPDLPCFGWSRRAYPVSFDASLDGSLDRFAAFVDALGVEQYRLVVHDWGSLDLNTGRLRRVVPGSPPTEE
jgi:pimeloyl-ACP methyl ester carboxylesterase